MRKRNEAPRTSGALSCSYCHHEVAVLRYVHYLKMYAKCSLETSQDLYPHLMDQYPHNGEPWAASVLSWCHSMRGIWGGMVDSGGVPMPLWKAWIATKQTGTEMEQGDIPF